MDDRIKNLVGMMEYAADIEGSVTRPVVDEVRDHIARLEADLREAEADAARLAKALSEVRLDLDGNVSSEVDEALAQHEQRLKEGRT